MYTFDLQEKDFLESLQSFSLERGVSAPKEPVWRGKRINIFRFYNLVEQHGGFENVSKTKQAFSYEKRFRHCAQIGMRGRKAGASHSQHHSLQFACGQNTVKAVRTVWQPLLCRLCNVELCQWNCVPETHWPNGRNPILYGLILTSAGLVVRMCLF